MQETAWSGTRQTGKILPSASQILLSKRIINTLKALVGKKSNSTNWHLSSDQLPVELQPCLCSMPPSAVTMGSEISLPSSKAVPLCCGSSFMHSYERTGSCDLLAEMCPEHHSQVPVSGRVANALKRLRVHCHRAVSFLLLVLSNLSSTDSCLRGDALLYLWGFLHTDYQEPRRGMTSQELHTFLIDP